MPELLNPATGQKVDAAPAATFTPPQIDRDEINREFSRAMVSGGEGQDPPERETPTADRPKAKRGRPRAEDKSRTEDKPKESQKVDKDFTEQLVGLTSTAWFAAASIPYTSPYATVIDANQAELVAALNGAAQNNAAIRSKIEGWSSGGGGIWAIQLAAVSTNMTLQAFQLLKDPQLRKEAAAVTNGKFRKFLKDQGVVLPDEQPQPAEPVPAPA